MHFEAECCIWETAIWVSNRYNRSSRGRALPNSAAARGPHSWDVRAKAADDRGLGSVTGRLGWTWGPGLLYAKGGVAFTDTTLGVAVAGVPVAFATTGNNKTGWTAGAGIEYMFTPNWSVKGEYQYYNFASTT